MRYEPMTRDRGRTWGIYDNLRKEWDDDYGPYSHEDQAQEVADRLNGKEVD